MHTFNLHASSLIGAAVGFYIYVFALHASEVRPIARPEVETLHLDKKSHHTDTTLAANNREVPTPYWKRPLLSVDPETQVLYDLPAQW